MSRIAQQRAVAFFAHIGHDALDGGQHGIERRAAALFERELCVCCAASCAMSASALVGVRISFIVQVPQPSDMPYKAQLC